MPTRIRIVAVAQNGVFHRTVEENRARMLGLLDKALDERPDLVCLPEAFPVAGVPGPHSAQCEPLDGPTVAACAERARKGRCYVVAPVGTRENGRLYNSAVILDRSGETVGVYHKRCPVTTSPDYTSLEDGTTPGGSLPVFDLDFGRIGIQICFDIGFPENWQRLAEKGAKLVLWPSAYEGGFPLRVYAFLHHYWVVSAVRTGRSRVIDPCGEILAESASGSPFAVRDINLDYLVAHWDFNFGIPNRARERYGERLAVRSWDSGAAHMILEPMDPTLTIQQVREELGVESCFEYHQRHRTAYRRAAEGKPLPPQKALHGKRPQYSP